MPVTLLAVAVVFYPRLRAGARATITLLGGFVGVLFGTEAAYYRRDAGQGPDRLPHHQRMDKRELSDERLRPKSVALWWQAHADGHNPVSLLLDDVTVG